MRAETEAYTVIWLLIKAVSFGCLLSLNAEFSRGEHFSFLSFFLSVNENVFYDSMSPVSTFYVEPPLSVFISATEI